MLENENKLTIRGVTFGGGTPKICVPVTARSIEEMKKQVKRIRTVPCDLVELRADYYEGIDSIDELTALREALPDLPILFTFRTKEEGGEREITPEDYAALNRRAAGLAGASCQPRFCEEPLADLIDIEYNLGEDFVRELCSVLHEGGVKVVMSYHDFEKTPDSEQITGLLTRMQNLGADITKVAVMPRTERDVLSLMTAAVEMKERLANRPYIMMSMGALGGITRLAGTLTGSAVTFASAGAVSAPGQMDAAFVAQACSVLSGI